MRNAAQSDTVIVVAPLVHIEGDLGHPAPEYLVDGLHPRALHLDMVAVHVQAEFVDPAVMEIAPGIGLGEDQKIGLIEQRLELPEGEIAEEGQRRLLGRLLAAVLAGGDQDRRLAAVDFFRAAGALRGQNAEQQTLVGETFDRPGAADLLHLHIPGLRGEGTEKPDHLLMLSIAGIAVDLARGLQISGCGRQDEQTNKGSASRDFFQHRVSSD